MNINVSNYEDVMKIYKTINAWGMLTCLDIKNCDSSIIESKEALSKYVKELSDLIDMKRFGEPQIVHFGEDEKVAGFSMTQLIETSLISGHFANASRTSYIDIFSCKPYDPYKAAEFSKNFFKASSFEVNVLFRNS
jgi:S-adenosylmethionine/arginine decarboxylase-like enzyme